MTLQVRLNQSQLNELELVMAGVYGAVAYSLPGPDSRVATLRVPLSAEHGNEPFELLDSDATPIARVDPSSTLPADAVTWVAGPVTRLRDPASQPFEDLRPGKGTRVPSALVFLDDGHDNPLARAVHGAPSDTAVRVLPVPAAEHVPAHDRPAHLSWLAHKAFADEVTIDRSAQDSSGGGTVVLLTGLSGSGKSTIARELARKLRETGDRPVTLLDGDEVRRMLSSGLGYSREDRELNVRRIGWVASLVSAHGGIAICAPIAPYESMRAEVREMAERVGRFVLVHVATPLEVCEARDRKGLYAKARSGEIKEFTGISDPYESPTDADVTVGQLDEPLEELVERLMKSVAVGSTEPDKI
ncbi:adenylyl-sulfate kinase [Demequina sp.]|uniref:adenylyl-sulfate kinase n=1 Tax=Demequina sp. TaxID=2050685 RepID=UPI0025C62E0E|nr:adenylyl-sulfate kinase [Demequina sp.]